VATRRAFFMSRTVSNLAVVAKIDWSAFERGRFELAAAKYFTTEGTEKSLEKILSGFFPDFRVVRIYALSFRTLCPLW
jgi:hypothetical protein